ncbi:MAG: GerMN domain-containing protein, partial [Clostridia bacterium]|nr:GerMN domain-containing protein [Clostridia bacterium]
LLVLTLLVLCAGCDSGNEGDKYSGFITSDINERPDQSPQDSPKASEQQPVKQQPTVNLVTKIYFSDDQEMYLVAEDLTLTDGNSPEAAAKEVIAALIKGPNNTALLPTLPQGTKLSAVQVENGLATVNFSADLRDKHSKGSDGENMTVYSIVNSLTELEGIDRVQILVDGEVIESLAGHIDLREPLEADPYLIKY